MKVSGAMAMADNLEAFGMTEGPVKSDSMVTRVADIIRSKVSLSCADDRCMCVEDDERWGCIAGITPIELARAAIESMREPSEIIASQSWCEGWSSDLWKHFIDLVLKETK